jgi:hypothetical protein
MFCGIRIVAGKCRGWILPGRVYQGKATGCGTVSACYPNECGGKIRTGGFRDKAKVTSPVSWDTLHRCSNGYSRSPEPQPVGCCQAKSHVDRYASKSAPVRKKRERRSSNRMRYQWNIFQDLPGIVDVAERGYVRLRQDRPLWLRNIVRIVTVIRAAISAARVAANVSPATAPAPAKAVRVDAAHSLNPQGLAPSER